MYQGRNVDHEDLSWHLFREDQVEVRNEGKTSTRQNDVNYT